jgi:CelD/BcsL family acetyltransferase involved in cellulose biosynthesis
VQWSPDSAPSQKPSVTIPFMAGGAVKQADSVSSRSDETLADVVAEWDALCDSLGVSSSLRPGWFSAYTESFGTGEPQLFTARRGDHLVGVVPMLGGRAGLSSPTNWHTPEFDVIAEDEGARSVLIEAMLDASSGKVDFGFVRDGSPLLAEAGAAAQRRGYRTINRTLETSPYIELDGDWEQFEAGMPSKRRADLRRRRRRLEEEGAYSFEVHDGTERLEELLDEGIAVEEAGWEGRDGIPIAAGEDTDGFYRRVGAWAAQGGYLRLYFLRLDAEAIAFAFCLLDPGSLAVLKIGFLPKYKRFAPGLLLTKEMIADSFAAGLDTYEFLGNSEPYKMIWTDRCRDRVRLQAFPRNPSGTAGYIAWKHGRSLAKWALRR